MHIAEDSQSTFTSISMTDMLAPTSMNKVIDNVSVGDITIHRNQLRMHLSVRHVLTKPGSAFGTGIHTKRNSRYDARLR